MILISCAEVIKYPTDKNTDAYITLYRAYSGKYRHAHDFLERRKNKAKKKFVKKGENIWKFGQKYTKFENTMKKGRLLLLLSQAIKY